MNSVIMLKTQVNRGKILGNGSKKSDSETGAKQADELLEYLDQFKVNGQSISDEPAWLERVDEISAFLPEHIMSGILGRLRSARGEQIADIPGFSKAFGLTPAEEKLLNSLAQGRSVPEHAELLRISVNTARVHMQRVLDKTAASGQLDLIRLLHSFK